MAYTLTQETTTSLDPNSIVASSGTNRHTVAEATSFQDMGEVDYESLPTEKLSAHLFAGGAAGIMEHCVMYPVDCVKTRMMQLAPNPQARYRNLFEAFKTIFSKENPRVLFKGIGVVAVGAGPAHAMYFSSYEFSKRWLSQYHNNIISQGTAAAIATLVHDGCMNPIEVVKQRLQVYNTPYRGALHCAKIVLVEEGFRAFYRSYTTQLTMNIPFQVFHFISYEFLQDVLNPLRRYDPLSHMLSGGAAGTIAAAATTPLDVAKTLLNTHAQKRTLARNKQIHGMLNAMYKIYQVKGVRGYFRGLSARVIYQAPSTAICWSVYEFFKYVLGLKEGGCEEFSKCDNVVAAVNSSHRR